MCAVTSATLICCTTGDYADCEDLGAVDWMLLKAVGQRHHVNTLHSATPLDATERCGPAISSECFLKLSQTLLDAVGQQHWLHILYIDQQLLKGIAQPPQVNILYLNQLLLKDAGQ